MNSARVTTAASVSSKCLDHADRGRGCEAQKEQPDGAIASEPPERNGEVRAADRLGCASASPIFAVLRLENAHGIVGGHETDQNPSSSVTRLPQHRFLHQPGDPLLVSVDSYGMNLGRHEIAYALVGRRQDEIFEGR